MTTNHKVQVRILLRAILIFLTLSQAACAHVQYQTSPSAPTYVQHMVTQPMGVGYKLCWIGDSTTGRGDWNGGWMQKLRQMCVAYHPEYNFQCINAGYGWLSNTILNRPGEPSPGCYWQQDVVAQQPDVVFIWIGIDNVLVNHGITTSGPFDMSQYGQDLQAIIDAARAIPSVKQIVLVTPMCAGERRLGQNAQDGQIGNLIAVINQTSINNNIPVVDLRSAIVDADLKFNQADVLEGCLTGDGIHPMCSTNNNPPDRINFTNDYTNWLIAMTFWQAMGM